MQRKFESRLLEQPVAKFGMQHGTTGTTGITGITGITKMHATGPKIRELQQKAVSQQQTGRTW